jgi:hypothetical protein
VPDGHDPYCNPSELYTSVHHSNMTTPVEGGRRLHSRTGGMEYPMHAAMSLIPDAAMRFVLVSCPCVDETFGATIRVGASPLVPRARLCSPAIVALSNDADSAAGPQVDPDSATCSQVSVSQLISWPFTTSSSRTSSFYLTVTRPLQKVSRCLHLLTTAAAVTVSKEMLLHDPLDLHHRPHPSLQHTLTLQCV